MAEPCPDHTGEHQDVASGAQEENSNGLSTSSLAEQGCCPSDCDGLCAQISVAVVSSPTSLMLPFSVQVPPHFQSAADREHAAAIFRPPALSPLPL
jgi:hypothetical protein